MSGKPEASQEPKFRKLGASLALKNHGASEFKHEMKGPPYTTSGHKFGRALEDVAVME